MLLKDYNMVLINIENENIFMKEMLKSDYDVVNYLLCEMNLVKYGGQCVLYEQFISLLSFKKLKEL